MLGYLIKLLVFSGGKEKLSMDGMLAAMDSHLRHQPNLIKPSPESKPRTGFDSDVPKSEMSMLNISPRQRLQAARQGLPLFINMERSARMYDYAFKPTRQQASAEFIQELEAKAMKLGVSDLSYVRIPRNAIFQDKGIPHEFALVYTVEMDKESLDSAPSFECQREVMRGYKNLAGIGNQLAEFMQAAGFAAYPGTALGGLTDYCHLAELAGLGAIGYHGLLISPRDGARLRINTIYTNISNLPRTKPNEHWWVRDFCAMCQKCVRACPVEAIFPEPRPRGDGGMQTIDHDSCRDYFSRNFGCAICLVTCPFSQVGYARIKSTFKGNPAGPKFSISGNADGANEMASRIG